jgi:hypothetical protein
MAHVFLFWSLLAGCCGYALLWGGPSERVVAAVFLAGDALSKLAMSPLSVRYARFETATFLVDLAMAVALLAIAIRSRRYWPMWMCAFQLVQLGSHFAGLLEPAILRLTYGLLISLWAYPMLLLLAVATVRGRLRAARGAPAAAPWKD